MSDSERVFLNPIWFKTIDPQRDFRFTAGDQAQQAFIDDIFGSRSDVYFDVHEFIFESIESARENPPPPELVAQVTDQIKVLSRGVGGSGENWEGIRNMQKLITRISQKAKPGEVEPFYAVLADNIWQFANTSGFTLIDSKRIPLGRYSMACTTIAVMDRSLADMDRAGGQSMKALRLAVDAGIVAITMSEARANPSYTSQFGASPEGLTLADLTIARRGLANLFESRL